MYTARQIFAYAVVCVFLLFFLLSGYSDNEFFTRRTTFPDFSQYNDLYTLDKAKYPTDARDRRTIIVGDIHGSDKSFHTLLDELSYDARSDELIHVGDIIAKGTHQGSLAVLAYMTANNVTGVRGNHDQKVIEWRAWMDWIQGMPGGKVWLADLDKQAAEELAIQGKLPGKWIKLEKKRQDKKWRKMIPEGWEILSDHYRIARDMTRKQYAYLLSLPIVLHVPSAHTYIVHAGLLPHDPTRSPTNRHQPLAHIPSTASKGKGKLDVDRLRSLQELALLHDIPQNTNAWVKLNMRSILEEERNDVTKDGKKGTPWSDIWNEAMGWCNGFEKQRRKAKHNEDDSLDGSSNSNGKSLPCRPATVVYGHAAGRGLDVKRWSFGVDSGCVYGRRLSALVLGSTSRPLVGLDKAGHDLQSVPYGEDGRGRIVSIECP